MVQLRKMVAQCKMKELISLAGELEVEKVDKDDEEEEEKSVDKDCAGDKIVCGTQILYELLSRG